MNTPDSVLPEVGGVVRALSNYSMQLTALRAAADGCDWIMSRRC